MKEKKEISVYFANWNLDRLPAEQAGEVAGIPWDCVTNIKHAFWQVTPADGSTETSFERRDRGDTPRTEFTIQSMWQKYDMEDLMPSAIDPLLPRNHFAQYAVFAKRYPDVEVAVRLPEDPLLVPMDGILIEQVLVNLMENAVIHGETHRIDVMLRREGDNAVFEVSDDGKGIPLSLLPRLFDGAARSDRRSDGKRSMGIGLSVCRTVVQAHGGTIRGDNKREGGACFTVTLPMKGDDNEDQG